jgi:hypothetical protein
MTAARLAQIGPILGMSTADMTSTPLDATLKPPVAPLHDLPPANSLLLATFTVTLCHADSPREEEMTGVFPPCASPLRAEHRHHRQRQRRQRLEDS